MFYRAMSEPMKPLFLSEATERQPVPIARRCWLAGVAAGAIGTWIGPAGAQPVSAAAEEAKAPPLPALGSLLAVPRIQRLDSTFFDPEQVKGSPLLVYWWSSTCPFCALQSPSMNQLWLRQKEKGLQMLALSIDRKPEDATAYVMKKGYGFPAAWASPAWRKAFPKPRGLPVTLLAGGDRRLLLAEKGQMFEEDVAEMASLM